VICITDLETTSLNVYNAEIIEGHLIVVNDKLEVVSTFDIKCNPSAWSVDAESIHGISRQKAATYKKFSESYQDLINWLDAYSVSEMWMHTNPNSYGKEVFYDYAVLRLQLSYQSDPAYWALNAIKPYSTHTLSKLFKDSFNFDGLGLASICKVLDIKLDHHNCVSDANACLEIMRKLLHKTSREDINKLLRGQYDTNTTSVSNPVKTRKRTKSTGRFQS